MARFDGQLWLVGDRSSTLPAQFHVDDDSLSIINGDEIIGDWARSDIRISAGGDGVHVVAEGEEIVLHSDQPGFENALLGASPVAGGLTDRIRAASIGADTAPPALPWWKRWWVIAGAVLVLLMAIGALGSGDSPSPDAAGETATTTPSPSTAQPPSTAAGPTSTRDPLQVAPSPPARDALVLDLLTAIPLELETQDGYDRDLFEVWSDLDGDGCDTRGEVLMRDAVETFASGSGCDVGTGLWYSVYDGVWLDDARQLEVDHVVALKEAWDSGAKDWDRARRVAFGNDLTSPLSLIAVSSSSNQAKGNADPSNWLPPNKEDLCRYIAAVVVIKARWELSMDESEHGRIRNLLESQCEGATVADAGVVYPAQPSTTTTVPAPTTTVGESADVFIADIRYDGPGDDVEFGDSEYVLLRNIGSGTADVGDWTLTDLADHVITIPSGYVINPGGELRIYSGPGNDTATTYYEGRGQAVWNNSGGDTATLRDATGSTVHTYSYSS